MHSEHRRVAFALKVTAVHFVSPVTIHARIITASMEDAVALAVAHRTASVRVVTVVLIVNILKVTQAIPAIRIDATMVVFVICSKDVQRVTAMEIGRVFTAKTKWTHALI